MPDAVAMGRVPFRPIPPPIAAALSDPHFMRRCFTLVGDMGTPFGFSSIPIWDRPRWQPQRTGGVAIPVSTHPGTGGSQGRRRHAFSQSCFIFPSCWFLSCDATGRDHGRWSRSGVYRSDRLTTVVKPYFLTTSATTFSTHGSDSGETWIFSTSFPTSTGTRTPSPLAHSVSLNAALISLSCAKLGRLIVHGDPAAKPGVIALVGYCRNFDILWGIP